MVDADNDNDPEAVVLRSEVLDLAGRVENMGHREMLDGIVQIGWKHDLNREIVGAKAIAEAVFGDRRQRYVERVKKLESQRLCSFRRWGPKAPISLTLGEVMVLRLELKARGRL